MVPDGQVMSGYAQASPCSTVPRVSGTSTSVVPPQPVSIPIENTTAHTNRRILLPPVFTGALTIHAFQLYTYPSTLMGNPNWKVVQLWLLSGSYRLVGRKAPYEEA